MDYLSIIPNKHKFLQIIGNIAKVPERLYLRGKLPTERIPVVAIVGTRKPTPYGREVTYRIAYELAQRGVVIISGLAFGIDSIAHRAALEAGGLTIAILGNGIDTVYPTSHQTLADEIVARGGAILSEYSPGQPAQKHTFLQRNRLISGLSDAIIVTEAASRSGSLNTVSHALEQGKDVYAVPGNITSPMSAGCNEIIKQGALPLTAIDDLQSFLPYEADMPLVQLIKKGALTTDDLAKKSGLSTSELLQQLSLLEMKGVLSFQNNKWTTR